MRGVGFATPLPGSWSSSEECVSTSRFDSWFAGHVLAYNSVNITEAKLR